jgi:uncharacterized membrane protein
MRTVDVAKTQICAARRTIRRDQGIYQFSKGASTMASALTVWKFETPEGAAQALEKLTALAKQQLITIQDAAVVSWPPGKKQPKTTQASNTAVSGALGGAFWGMLFGLIFFVPIFGLAVGAAMGALAGHFADYGIDDSFIESVRNQVTEGTSALFLMSANATEDKVAAAFKGTPMQLIKSNLSAEQEAKLNADFGENA